MSDNVRINGVVYGWSSVKLKIDGELYSGGTDIEFADGVEKTKVFGMGRHHAPRARTRGKYTAEPFVFTAFAATARQIRAAINAKAGTKGIANYEVQIILQMIEQDDGGVITVELFDCVLIKNESSHSEGPEALMEKVTFDPMRIKRNGIALYDTSEAGA
jgi:hypothetical protein